MEKRHSMNTSLKNARIFDDDSWDEISAGFIKREDVENKDSSLDTSLEIQQHNIKTEIKQEFFDEDTIFPINSEAFAKIEIKKEVLEEISSPVKNENSDSNSRQSFKSAKVSVYKTRESPYKRNLHEQLMPSTSKLRSPQLEESSSQRRIIPTPLETDPAILSRRQKQIDYGKNTIGYDNYCQAVPKNKRKPEDPQTPKKHLKYSRRGWDGLIKQWRLQLHKFDPSQ